MTDLPANPSGKFELGPKERAARLDHREWIGGRVYTLLCHYWREDDEDMLSAAIAADWADVLEGIPQEYIRRACIQYQRDEPRRKPTPGAIYQIAKGMMPMPRVAHTAPPPEEPERKMPTQEEREAILRDAGFTPKRFGGET